VENHLSKLVDQYGGNVELWCCYEASWLGVWLARWLAARSVNNHVVAPSTLEVTPKKKRKKTDRIDVRKLVRKLKQYREGDRRAFSPVRVPTLQEEAIRQRQRERALMKKQVQQHQSQLASKLCYYGIPAPVKPRSAKQWHKLIEGMGQMKTYNGDSIPVEVVSLMARATERLALAQEQLAQVELEIRQYHRSLESNAPAKKLERLRGVGMTSSQQLCAEIMDWGRFTNRKQPGAFAGLCPTPWGSGGGMREQGIGKDGNPRIRSMMVELAWLWLRWQPSSALAQRWGPEVAKKGRRRKTALVALARELLVALWRYVAHDVPIAGAVVAGEKLTVH